MGLEIGEKHVKNNETSTNYAFHFPNIIIRIHIFEIRKTTFIKVKLKKSDHPTEDNYNMPKLINKKK